MQWLGEYLRIQDKPVVYMAWRRFAQQLIKHTISKHYDKQLILEASHPAATRYGHSFVGCNHFVKANEFLELHGIKPIVWSD